MGNLINLYNGRHTCGHPSGGTIPVLSQALCKSGQGAFPAIHATYQVTALYADGVLSFSLSSGDTFADLAKRLEYNSRRHLGAPMAIYLKSAKGGIAEPRPPTGCLT